MDLTDRIGPDTLTIMTIKSTAEFATTSAPTPGTTLLRSSNVWEHVTKIEPGDVSPHTIARLTAESIQLLEDQCWTQHTALDWDTFRSRVVPGPLSGFSLLSIRVDVL